jgi:hypothetical protein
LDTDRHLDVDKARDHFLKNFESLSRLPLISDAEMEQLFGAEVSAALTELYQFNQKGNICRQCNSRCCLLVSCELYTARLSRCPIYSYRPVLCRVHFCNQYAPEYRTLVKKIGDIYIESLIEADRMDSEKVYLFDSPPLMKLAPELVAKIASYILDFKEGRLDEPSTFGLIEAAAEKYRCE